MWNTKTFMTREKMSSWLKKWEGRIQWEEIFINKPTDNSPGYAVQWRPLRQVS